WTVAGLSYNYRASQTANSSLSEGSKTYSVSATDSASHTQTFNSGSVVVDNTAPGLNSVSGPANGTYRAGLTLDFTVNYGENVTVTGTPTIGLTIGATARNASYVSGSGTSAVVFRYTVQAGDADTDGIVSASPISLNGGTMKDRAGIDAPLSFTPPNTS